MCSIKSARPRRRQLPEVDWQAAPLSALIDHILTTHHAYMKAQLPRLDGMLQKILSKHGDRHGDVLRPMAETFRPMREELENHLMKEELILFPSDPTAGRFGRTGSRVSLRLAAQSDPRHGG